VRSTQGTNTKEANVMAAVMTDLQAQACADEDCHCDGSGHGLPNPTYEGGLDVHRNCGEFCRFTTRATCQEFLTYEPWCRHGIMYGEGCSTCELAFTADLLACQIMGHTPHDYSEAGPESGYVLVICEHCGVTLAQEVLY
jgi:hypothetical protein